MIIAVDFDGTLCSECWPDIGEPNTALIRHLIHMRESGAKLILNTLREEEDLDAAVQFCAHYGLYFDAVNDNLQEMKEKYKNNPRKIYADVYIDDKNVAPIGIYANIPFYGTKRENADV